MQRRITFDEAMGILRSHADSRWLDAYMATPEGAVVLSAMADLLVESDAHDADDVASLYVRKFPGRIGDPAARAEKATTTLSITKTRVFKVPIEMAAGSRVQTAPDGHVYVTNNAIRWGAAELGSKTVGATALVPGWPGIIPPDEITEFVRIGNGGNGIGTDIDWIDDGTGDMSVRFHTVPAQPDLFRSDWAGLYVEVVATDPGAPEQNIGLLAPLAQAGSIDFAPEIESEYGSAVPRDPTVDLTDQSLWYFGAFGFTWIVRDWQDLGFRVRNTTRVTGGKRPVLDEKALEAGRPPNLGEDSDSLRERVMRHPQKPTPLGVLRKLIEAIRPYGFVRRDLRIYELGQPPPDSIDPYAENFPGASGFLADIHVADMDDPETPDGMVSVDMAYAPLATYVNPGLALTLHTLPARSVVIRWDPPPGMSTDDENAMRVRIMTTAERARPPGTEVEPYNPDLWSYP